MKLENCGRCGLEAETVIAEHWHADGGYEPALYGCPVVHDQEPLMFEEWNAAQFAARTERINSLICRLAVHKKWECPDAIIAYAEGVIDAQDAATRARWDNMQGADGNA